MKGMDILAEGHPHSLIAPDLPSGAFISIFDSKAT